MEAKTYPVAPLGMLGKVYLLDEKNHATYKKINTYCGSILTILTIGLLAVDKFFKTTLLSQYLWLFFVIMAIYITILFKFASRGTIASKQETSDFISSRFNSSSMSSKILVALMRVFQILSILFIIFISVGVAGVLTSDRPFPYGILYLYIPPVLCLVMFYIIKKRTKK